MIEYLFGSIVERRRPLKVLARICPGVRGEQRCEELVQVVSPTSAALPVITSYSWSEIITFVSTSESLTEPWHSALLEAGFTGPTGAPSLRRLAEAMDVHPSTVSRVIRGTNARGARPDFVRKLAEALKRKPEVVAAWAGERWEAGLEAYSPPDGSETLTLRQREAADRMIRAFIEVNRRERSRRALDSKMVRGLAERLGRTRAQVADALEELETVDE